MIELLRRLNRLRSRILHRMQYFEGNEGLRKEVVASMLRDCGVNFQTISDAASLRNHRLFDASRSAFENRLRRGDHLIFLVDGAGAIVAFGWMTYRDWFWISEIGLSVKARGRPILYDFYTPLEHQQRGYHTLLLRMAFATLPPNRNGLIFALSDNTPPLRAYERIGLRKLSNLQMLLRGDFALGDKTEPA